MRILVSGGTATPQRCRPKWDDWLGHLDIPAKGASRQALESSGLPVAADNGAFTGFNAGAFRRMVEKLKGLPTLLWVVCPDVVADAAGTLRLFEEWVPQLRSVVPVAFVLQDGQERLEVPWRYVDAVFVGGSTAWKVSEAAGDLVAEAKRRKLWAHMGRVNSLRRIRTAIDFGCDSVDGGQFSRWGDVKLDRGLEWVRHEARRHAQPSLFRGPDDAA